MVLFLIAQSVFSIAILDGSGFGILVAWLVVILAGRLEVAAIVVVELVVIVVVEVDRRRGGGSDCRGGGDGISIGGIRTWREAYKEDHPVIYLAAQPQYLPIPSQR